MQSYRNRQGGSGVTAYENGADYILVEFKRQVRYSYTYRDAGKIHVDLMQTLAPKGQGLCTYVVQNDPPYTTKEYI